MSVASRRSFLLTAGTVAVSAAGAAAAGPALAGGRSSHALLTPEADIPELDGPLVMYVKDAHKGEIAVLLGEREVVVTDRAVVAKLIRAARA